jgi:predicted ATPase
MLTHLHLRLGSSAGQPALTMDTPPSVTIFVGPNNAGKSLALRELHSHCVSGNQNTATSIVEKVTFEGGSEELVVKEIEAAKLEPRRGEQVTAGHSILRVGRARLTLRPEKYLRARTDPNGNPHFFAQLYLQHFLLNLDGPSRIGLVNAQTRGDLKDPQGAFARLLTDDAQRGELRTAIHGALGLYFAIDAQAGDQLNIRFGNEPPPDERSFNDAALEYMRRARSIEDVSDGVKAFTGILVQLYAGDPKVIIIDEPEAFLHPSLAFKLGSELAKGAVAAGKHVFAATHSPQFLMGSILSGAQVNIIRLTYSNSVGGPQMPGPLITPLLEDI